MKIELISGFESGAKRERIVLDAGETTDAAGSTKKVWRGPGFFCRLTHADGAREDYHGMVPDAAGYGAAVLTDRPEGPSTVIVGSGENLIKISRSTRRGDSCVLLAIGDEVIVLLPAQVRELHAVLGRAMERS